MVDYMLLAMVFDWFLFRSCMKTVATPKQIRELMKVDGLTNDEVKSHLQVYINYFILSLSLSLYIHTVYSYKLHSFLSLCIHTYIYTEANILCAVNSGLRQHA